MDLHYTFTKLNEAINGNTGHRHLALVEGAGYIDQILKHSKNSENFDEISNQLERLRKYFTNAPEDHMTKGEAKSCVNIVSMFLKDLKNNR